MIEEQLTIEPALDAVAHGDHAQRVPAAEGRRRHAGARELVPCAIVEVEPEVVLERIRARDVVSSRRVAEHDPARGVLPSGDGLEADRHVHVGVRAARRDDDGEGVLGRALHEHALAARCVGRVLDHPATVHRRPAAEAAGLEIDAHDGR